MRVFPSLTRRVSKSVHLLNVESWGPTGWRVVGRDHSAHDWKGRGSMES